VKGFYETYNPKNLTICPNMFSIHSTKQILRALYPILLFHPFGRMWTWCWCKLTMKMKVKKITAWRRSLLNLRLS